MSTRNIVPRADGEGNIGTSAKRWLSAFFHSLSLFGAFIMQQITTPSNPSAGYNKLYFKSNDKLYTLTSGGIESEVMTSGNPSFSVHKNGVAQTISPLTWTKVTWPTEEWDTNNNFANDTFTPTVAGKYLLLANVNASIADTKHIYLKIYKNGSQYIATGALGNMVSIGAIVDANGTTDYFEIYIYHNDDVNRDIEGASHLTHFSGHRLG